MWMCFHLGKLPFFYPRNIPSAWALYQVILAMELPLPVAVLVGEDALLDHPHLLSLQTSRSASRAAYLGDHQLFSYSKAAPLHIYPFTLLS